MVLKFSKKELHDLLISDLILSLAFTIIFAESISSGILLFPIMILVVTLSFVVHELAHKYMAQKYKYVAEFRANIKMLLVTLLLSILGYIIAAPGAVHIFSHRVNKHHLGMIAWMGPLSNIILSIIFLGLSFFFNVAIFSYIYYINAILGLFNLLPVPGFDGLKIWKWNKAIHIITICIALILYFSPHIIMQLFS